MKTEYTTMDVTLDVIYMQDLIKNPCVPCIVEFEMYRLEDGVIKLSAGIRRKPNEIFIYNVSSASEEFKEEYKDIIKTLSCKQLIKVVKGNCENDTELVRVRKLVSVNAYTDALEPFAIYEYLAGGILKENPGVKIKEGNLFYDITSASSEIKEKFADVTVDLVPTKIIPFDKKVKENREKQKVKKL